MGFGSVNSPLHTFEFQGSVMHIIGLWTEESVLISGAVNDIAI